MKSFVIPLMLILLISMVGAYPSYYQDYDYQGYGDCGITKKLYAQENRDIRYVQKESSGCKSCQIVKNFFVEKKPAEIRYIQSDVVRTCTTCYVKEEVSFNSRSYY